MAVLKKGAIVPIRKAYTDLVAENLTYYRGQIIFAETTFGSRLGVKVGTKDVTTGLGGIPFVQLPWLIDPNISYGGNKPFTVRNTDPSYSYNNLNDTVTITDNKLVGIQDPVVYSTQTNTLLRDTDYTFNSTTGTMTITSLSGGLENGDKLAIFTGDGLIPGGTSYDARLTLLEKLTAPLLNGSVRVFLKANSDGTFTIPAGWVEDQSMRGVFPMGYIPGDPDFGINKTGGQNTVTLGISQLPSHSHELLLEKSVDEQGGYGLSFSGGFKDRVLVQGGSTVTPSYSTETKPIGDGQSFSIVNKFQTGIWIKYTG